MASTPLDQAHWASQLSTLAAQFGVPGASLGILRLGRDGAPDEIITATTGQLNAATGQPVTEQSIFQIGSITKVWTATVIMQLVDEGRLALETKVKDIIPGFQLIDPATTAGLTVWHLLTHTSGIDGDIFTDTGRGDDCLEQYVSQLATAAQNYPLGATWSYCNSGYVILGRIIEVVTGQTWDEALKERLYVPLGLTDTVTLPEDAILRSVAVGHVVGLPNPVVAPVWHLGRSSGPAGYIVAPAREVLAFAQLHLRGGVAPDGSRLLSESSARAMAAFQAEVPDKYTLGDSWGLGWIRFDWHGRRLIGHDGNTVGQAAFLRLLPDAGLAVTLLTNGGQAGDLYEHLYRQIFASLADADMQQPIMPPALPVQLDPTPYLGTYENVALKVEIFTDQGAVKVRVTMKGALAAIDPHPVEEYVLIPVGPGLYAVQYQGQETWIAVTFYTLDTGEAYVHFGGRAIPRQAG